MTQHEGQAWVEGGHVPSRAPLADLIEPAGDGGFALLGRQADMVNIAGKRSSLAYLTQVLLRVPGVVDGAFFVPEEPNAEITRLAAAVVAPAHTSGAILSALREHLDPVFLPRPLLMVPSLPRSDTRASGLRPRGAAARGTWLMNAPLDAPLALPADHPALAGHFPGHPIYPGVVLLDAAIGAIEAHFGAAVCGLPVVKFLAPVTPGRLDTACRARGSDVRFELVMAGGSRVATGSAHLGEEGT